MPEGNPTTKRCTKCGKAKPLESGFGRDSHAPHGRCYHCKTCKSAFLAANRDKVIASRAASYANNKEAAIARIKLWQAENPEKVASYHKTSRERHPERLAARSAVSGAIRAGKLTAEPCSVCGLEPKKVNGRQRIYAHHHKGYEPEFWLDVQWLCGLHHGEAEL